ncbi:MAG: FMN-binding protein [Oscillospiraceae bacterium]|nr:FMN-binding protein [Oscillospiraceae bacterium]MDE7170486.1 FMN-binding protein [Oscillospiraceae bacterium]
MKVLRKRIILSIIIVTFIFGLIVGTVYLKNVADYKKAVKETTFDEINISDVSDGIYIGEYDVNFIYAKVEVTVQNGKIIDISILEHKHERGKAAEAIIDEIVDEQRIDVDAISGATNSSTVIKKAVENALKRGS